MDVRSLSSSESELLLLISSDTVDMTMPPPKAPVREDDSVNEWGRAFSVHSHEPGSPDFGSEIILRNIEPRKKSRKAKLQDCNSSANRSHKSWPLRSQPQPDHGPTRKLRAKTEDSSANHKILTREETFDGLHSEKTGKSSFGSWIKKRMMRFGLRKDGRTKQPKLTKNGDRRREANKKLLGQVVVVNGSESIDTHDRDELSSWLGSMSVGDIRKVFGSGENSVDEALPKTLSELMDDNQSTSSRPKIDFRNRLNIYKAHSPTGNDVQRKVQRLNKEASFMLMSFSVAPSESNSFSDDTDASTTDDNLAEAIVKEMNLRRLIMGEPEPEKEKEKEKIAIQEVVIPAPKTKSKGKTKKTDVLSPRQINASNQGGRKNNQTSHQLTKPGTPLEHLAGLFFNSRGHENNCGASKGMILTLSP